MNEDNEGTLYFLLGLVTEGVVGDSYFVELQFALLACDPSSPCNGRAGRTSIDRYSVIMDDCGDSL